MTRYLNLHKGVYGYYLWLGVTDAGGRIVAATDPASVGRNESKRGWFRAVRERGVIYVEDAEPSEYGGGAFAVTFTAPIKGSRGEFLGTVSTRVRMTELEQVFERTVRAFQAQRGPAGRIEWQFMNRDGDLIVDSFLRQEGMVNLKVMGLPSALFVGTTQPGYVEEMHLRRHVPVVTGYAQTEQRGNFLGLHWGILIRMDRSDILAPIQAVLWKLGDRKSTRLNSSHSQISYAVFCLKKKKINSNIFFSLPFGIDATVLIRTAPAPCQARYITLLTVAGSTTGSHVYLSMCRTRIKPRL